ncbi:hypothetical protein KIN20_022068 [Parelaphostrongylus tenuis]|uniref:R3H domain-containing protein n=1 Tax=Parelaphostrongylus tenuis TaxID=148309 RepID=A0AAD5MTK2_PARTN|nr:hypothetical protein KIN20_022068 [Parelaphostrongylus tenuis]
MVGGDTGTVSGSEQDSASCANSESAMKIESTATPVSDQATNIESSDDNCAETSGAAAESPPQTENHESQDSGVTRCTVTKGTQSTELGADGSIISSKDSNSTTTNSSSHPRRKLSKQDNVNERYSPTCTGPIEQDYVSPTTCCGSVSVKSSVADESLIATNSAGIKCTDNDAWVTTTIGNVKRRPESETTNSSVMPPTHGSVSNETTHLQPTTANGQSHLAPLVNHSYEGFIPSRARQLVRSLAMCGDDDTRLRPPPRQVVNSFASMRPFGFPMQSKHSSSSLSRESSYTDHTSDLGDMELRSFIVATLHKNPRDRALILELEQIFVDFICNSKEQSIKLPPVSSYTRMIIHRIAVLFGLDHNVDNSGKCVVVSKTDRTKRPDFVFASLIQSNIFTDTRRVCATPWNCREYAVGELARRAQSFESACFPPNTETDLSQQGHPWSLKSQRSFENQHFPYYRGFYQPRSSYEESGEFRRHSDKLSSKWWFLVKLRDPRAREHFCLLINSSMRQWNDSVI